MAVVVISDKLKREVIHNVKSLYTDRLSVATRVPGHWYGMVVNKLFTPELKARIDSLPPGYFMTDNQISISGPSVDGRSGVPLMLSGSQRFTLPAEWSPAANGIKGAGRRYLELMVNDPRWSEFLTEYTEWVRNSRNIQDERDQNVNKVTALMAPFRTLAPAIKAWPPLLDLLPRWALDKHKEATPGSKPRAVAPDLDLTDLTTSIVANKITKSNG